MRIGYRYYPCVKASMISQIIMDDDRNFTCRKWDPRMIEAPFEFEIVKESNWERNCCFKLFFCIPNFCKCCNNKFKNDETLEKYQDGEHTVEQLLGDSTYKNSCKTFWLFILSFFLMYVGFWFILNPFIFLLDWVPMVRYLNYWIDRNKFEIDDEMSLGNLSWWGLPSLWQFTLAITVDACLCTYAVMHSYWRYTEGLPLAIIALICCWATFTGSIEWGLQTKEEYLESKL